jgi:hypothetical protein
VNYEIRWRAASAPVMSSPWWLVSHDAVGRPVFVGAVRAADPESALALVQAAHSEPVVALDACVEQPEGWEPFGAKRPRKAGVVW